MARRLSWDGPDIRRGQGRTSAEALEELVRLPRRSGRLPTRSSRRRGGCRPLLPRSLRILTGPTSGCARRWRPAASISSTRTRPRRSTTPWPAASGHHHADGVGQDALLQRAGAQRDPAGSVERARCICFRPRRSRRISSPSCTPCRTSVDATTASRSACSPTTAIRRRTRGARFAARAHVVLSNPDMVHSGILPHHPRWAKLFENLRYVVIDELHAYRGVFGSHLTKCCGGCAASAGTTARSRCSCARRRRSPIRASWPKR